MCHEIVARYLKATGVRSCVTLRPDTGAGPVEERSLVPLGEARLGHITLDEWLRHPRFTPFLQYTLRVVEDAYYKLLSQYNRPNKSECF